ncbi:diaminopimelate epimerase [Falsibacillus albus]|uniref:Diaminopimelate epimerase n=1 Tax=Falsibacillus albus TaxID=2478915 RepID=A0A3L7JWW8_9BACI|nr:diaminopimelate epimerase [Falsibacillus albus]RLQ95236.1 diaminopimelate epimerase [Falsibacillus albus]
MEIQLTKCHGSGNDFLLIDEMANSYSFGEKDRQNLAIALCDRQEGLGADGILFVLKSHHADAKMRVFNSDGSEASMCGNGLRCVGRYVCESLGKEEILVETMKADLLVQKTSDIFDGIPAYSVEISPVLFDLTKLPMRLDQERLFNERVEVLSDHLAFTAVAVPNPHLISFVDRDIIRSNEQKSIAEFVNGPNSLFPDGVNVSFVLPLGKGKLYVRTYERGVGFTNACGTAMSASTLVSAMMEINDLEEKVEVYNNGGKVHCVVKRSEQDDSYTIFLIGNATYLYSADIKVDEKNPEKFTMLKKNEFDEQQQYDILSAAVKEYLEKEIFFSSAK